MTRLESLLHRAPAALARGAGFVTLLALAIMAWSILVPKPLPIVLAMSLGHVVGVAGFALYCLAVVLDAKRASNPRSGAPSVNLAKTDGDDSVH